MATIYLAKDLKHERQVPKPPEVPVVVYCFAELRQPLCE
jgi:hypothetical protein